MPEKLSPGIEKFLSQKEEEPDEIFPLSVRYPAFLLPCFLLVAGALWFSYPKLGGIVAWSGIFFCAFLVERRRVCRVELGNFGIRAYGFWGKRFLDIDRVTISYVDLEESMHGKDFTVTARGRDYVIPQIYDGYFKIIATLEHWAASNRAGP
jgi:hypothetical protein